ncbi:MAG: sulfatase-like hydrolase/transferase, partial [Planctomycetales bacterium]|nr:sulfatase-like hydrolase/transferase [Planctomycetales bacterium]
MESERPNVVFILTDNQGAWSLGCYGNPDIKTPHIDRLARDGTLFRHAYANNAVCSPTRATLLTGLMPCQHGVHCYLSAGRLQIGPQASNTLAEFPTLPSLLAEQGYVCGLSGKWHLGDNLHPQEGFSFWTTKPHGSSKGFYDQQIIENGQMRIEPKYLTDYWTDRGIEFIEKNRQRPFFLMLAYNGPYGLGGTLDEPIRNRHAETYGDAELPSFPRIEPHPWNFNYANRIGDLKAIRKYAAEVSGIDDGVGRMLATLERLGLADNTLVVFTADQGLSGGHSGFWGMGDHTRPLTAFDWTMHVPLIIKQPRGVAAGRTVDSAVSHIDFLPTMCDLLRLHIPDDAPAKSPGNSYVGMLSNKLHGDWDEDIYYEFENVRAIRTPGWKYIERFGQSPNEFYNCAQDPGETKNLIDDPNHSALIGLLRDRMHRWFADVADPKWDIWNGGRSKSHLMMAKVFAQANAERKQPVTTDDAKSGDATSNGEAGFTPSPLEVPQGYTVEMAAAPSLVAHPLMACFDEQGRLYVAANAGENLPRAELEQRLPNLVQRLEDTDGDGVFDRATTFADKM